MALANLIIKIGADIAELKSGADKAVSTVESASKKIDSIGSVLQKTLVGAFSVGAIVNFGKSVFNAAGEIGDMSSALGISGESLQRFAYAAEQSGGSMNDVVTSINFMNKALSGGEKSTVKALKEAGLSFQDIRNMKPDQAFLAITEAVKNISDPMLQAQVRTELLGKASVNLASAINDGFGEVGKTATVMSEDTIKALKDAEDAWGRLSTKVTVVTGNIIGKTLNATDQVTSSWQSFTKFAEEVLTRGAGNAGALASAMDQASRASKKLGDVNLPLATKIHKTAEEIAAEEKAAAAAARAIEQHAKAIQALRDKYSGAELSRQVRDMSEAMRGLKADADWKGLAEDAGKLFDQGAKLPPTLLNIAIAFGTLSPKVDQSALDFRKLGQSIDIVVPKIDDVWEMLNKPVPHGLTHLRDEFAALVTITPETMLKEIEATTAKLPKRAFEAIFGKPKEFGARMGATIMAAIQGGGDIFAAIGGTIGMDVGTHFGDKLGKFFSKEGAGTFSKALGGMFSSVLPGIGALMGPLLGKIGGAIANVFNRNKGRDIVEEFAAGFGGFESLHKQLGELGARGEQLWIKLTQGVGRNNPDQAKAAIEAITAALDKQKGSTDLLTSAMQEYGFTWEDLPAEKRSVELASMFDTLFEKTQVLKDAGIDYHEILLRQATGYSELVQSAIRSGTEIPSAMQPVLQDLVDLGLLVDENGESFKDLGEVSWAKTLTQGFDQVTKAIYDLTDALTKGVGGALDQLGRREVRIPIKFDVDDTPGGGGKPPGFATGTRGQYINFGAGEYVQLHGRERIVTEQEDLGVEGGATYISIGNKEILDFIVSSTRKDAARGGLRPRAGSGRSW